MDWTEKAKEFANKEFAEYCINGKTIAVTPYSLSVMLASFASEVERLTLAKVRELALQIEMHCPCGARPETFTKPDRYGRMYLHVGGCPVEKLVAVASSQGGEQG